jgi:hypothetical protein
LLQATIFPKLQIKKIKMKFSMLLFLLFFGIGIGGCGKDNDEKDDLAPKNTTYQKAILGKWELVAQGTSYDISDDVIHPTEKIYPVEPNMQWLECLPNWMILIYNALELKKTQKKFFIESIRNFCMSIMVMEPEIMVKKRIPMSINIVLMRIKMN